MDRKEEANLFRVFTLLFLVDDNERLNTRGGRERMTCVSLFVLGIH